MALVEARQELILEGYTEFKEKAHLFARAKYVRESIYLNTWVVSICDETQIESVIKEKIKEEMEQSAGWGRNFEGWTSYRKYCRPGESIEYPDGKEFKLEVEYIRDWKMKKVIKKLDASQFAILCKELGISAGEAISKV